MPSASAVKTLAMRVSSGIFSSSIGALLSIYGKTPEEAAPFLSEALQSGTSCLLTAIVGYVFLFRSRNDWDSSIDILSWGIDLLAGLKTESKLDVLEKTHAEMLVLLAYVQAKAGMREESTEALKKARTMALRFDSMPDYSLKAMRFAEHMDHTAVFDIFGATASGSIDNLIGLLNDQRLADRWAETAAQESIYAKER